MPKVAIHKPVIDHYQALGLSRDATISEIKSAYRLYASKFHPDKQGGDKFFAERFREIKEAYDILSDSKKRRVYDAESKPNESSGGFDFKMKIADELVKKANKALKDIESRERKLSAKEGSLRSGNKMLTKRNEALRNKELALEEIKKKTLEKEINRCKSKYTAAVLAVFLGSYGIHRFYLRQYKEGILYLIFCWTLIPAIAGIIDGLKFLFMKQDLFNEIYNPNVPALRKFN